MKSRLLLASILIFFLFLPYWVEAQFKNTEPASGNSMTLPGGPVLGGLLGNFLLIVLGAIGVFSIIGFVIAGIMWATAAASEDKLSAASNVFVYSLVGVIISVGGIILLSYVRGYLGI